jgi:hypothetical protein
VSNCMLVDDPASDLSSLRARCEVGEALRPASDWSVNGAPGGVPALGTVVGRGVDTGTFTAPARKPTPSLVSVSAVISDTRSGQRTTLVSNVTIVDVKGWSGSVRYGASGSQTTSETITAGTISKNTQVVVSVTGNGSISFEPGAAVPGLMIATTGSGTWTQSSVTTLVATDTQPLCPQVNMVVDDVQLSGQATNPAGTMALLTTSGNTYQLGLSTLSGYLSGTHRITTSGGLTAGGTGTNCVAPVASDMASPTSDPLPQESLLLEGTIDAANPNLITGRKSFSFGTIPVQYLVDWQFRK